MTADNRFFDISDCILCPRACCTDRTAGPGYCGCDDQIRIAGYSLHPWEEPCISGSKGSGTVFFMGCSLGCIFCQNISISRSKAAGRVLSSDELAGIFLTLQSLGAHNINLVTPSHYTPLLIPSMRKARESGLSIPYVWNTGSYERPEVIRSLHGLVDIYLADLKFMNPALSAKYCAAPDYFEYASASVAEMVQQCPEPVFDEDGMLLKGVIVRHLAMPRQAEDSRRILDYLHWTYGSRILISLMNQYTPMPGITERSGSSTDPDIQALSHRLSRRAYEKLTDHAISLGIENGYIQEGRTASESFIPELIKKTGDSPPPLRAT